MLNPVPEKQSLCFPADWKAGQILMLDWSLEKSICMQVFFFRQFFSWTPADFKDQLQTGSKWCTITHGALQMRSRNPRLTFFLFVSFHSQAREETTRLRHSRAWPHSFLHHEDTYGQLELASAGLYISWKSVPGTLEVRRICRIPAALGCREPALTLGCRCCWVAGSIPICFLSFYPLFTFV